MQSNQSEDCGVGIVSIISLIQSGRIDALANSIPNQRTKLKLLQLLKSKHSC